MNLIGRLQTLCDLYCSVAAVPRTRVSRVIFADQRRLDLVFHGRTSLTTRSFERAMAWFSANWPEGLAWPDGVERPASDAANADALPADAPATEGAAA